MTYTLPDLAYDYGALEPHISAEIMTLHHDKHHAAYVDGANTTLDKLASARDAGDFATIPMLEKNLAFHVSGHVLHSLFWANLSPNGGEPTGDLAAQLDADFGGLDKFKAHMTQATATIQGSGWGLASWEPVAGKIVVNAIQDHQSNFAVGAVPLFTIDAWEHAFYLQYKNVKADYFTAIWNVVNWDDIAARLAAAKA